MKIKKLISVILTLSIIISASLIPPIAEADTDFSGDYYLKHVLSPGYLCTDPISSGATASAAAFNSNGTEWWIFTRQNNGSYTIKNKATGYYLGWQGNCSGGSLVKQFSTPYYWQITGTTSYMRISSWNNTSLCLGMLYTDSLSGGSSLGFQYKLSGFDTNGADHWNAIKFIPTYVTIFPDDNCMYGAAEIRDSLIGLTQYALEHGKKLIMDDVSFNTARINYTDNCDHQYNDYDDELVYRYGMCNCNPNQSDNEATNIIPDSEAATRLHHNNKWNNYWNLAYYTHYNPPAGLYLSYNILISGHSLCYLTMPSQGHDFMSDGYDAGFEDGKLAVIPVEMDLDDISDIIFRMF